MAETLLKKETLNYADVEALIGPPPYGKKRLIEPAEFEEMMKSKPSEGGSAETEDTNNNSKGAEQASSA